MQITQMRDEAECAYSPMDQHSLEDTHYKYSARDNVGLAANINLLQDNISATKTVGPDQFKSAKLSGRQKDNFVKDKQPVQANSLG